MYDELCFPSAQNDTALAVETRRRGDRQHGNKQ